MRVSEIFHVIFVVLTISNFMYVYNVHVYISGILSVYVCVCVIHVGNSSVYVHFLSRKCLVVTLRWLYLLVLEAGLTSCWLKVIQLSTFIGHTGTWHWGVTADWLWPELGRGLPVCSPPVARVFPSSWLRNRNHICEVTQREWLVLQTAVTEYQYRLL